MARKELRIGLALIVAAMAAGFVVWSTFTSKPNEGTTPPVSASVTPSPYSYLVKPMTDAASSGGFASTFSGPSARSWCLTGGHKLERVSLNGAEPVWARLSSTIPLERKNIVGGLQVELTREFANFSSGKQIEVGLVVRKPWDNPSSSVSVNYATRQAGNSGWHSFPLSTMFELRAFTFDVPERQQGYSSKPLIVIRCGEDGSGRAIELSGVYAKITSNSGSNSSAGVQFRKRFGVNDDIDWKVPLGHRLVAIKDPDTGLTLGQLGSSIPLDPKSAAFGSQGPSLLIPATLTQKLNGKFISIVIRARAAAVNPADKLLALAIFSTKQAAGWWFMTLSNEIESYSLNYLVPKLEKGYEIPFLIVLQANNDGTEKLVEIESIEIVVTQLVVSGLNQNHYCPNVS